MSSKSDKNVRKILGTAAVALAVPAAASAAAAINTSMIDNASMSSPAGKRQARLREDGGEPELFPLKLRPSLTAAKEVGEKPIQVKVMDSEGRRILLARAHGNITLGPLPAGEYRLQLRSGANTEEHAMKLGSGKRGLLRYELGA
ncbi:hypothetical protein G3580_18640 [Nitrogeniibacter mangrovi]|uniref:Carboxypeptidase regulatory-like domain-containing protein n=1 Tax=Nitrogeniibacter mangrovi TaxID=2016596 RepID=A0A6C1B9U8_9RHOO|nr:hypothetical protein [Nitrogeniibacter mangrovi]QID19458.1 hypothetical protein G3580_18640 [Nitrogeniibacter mangrovi]